MRPLRLGLLTPDGVALDEGTALIQPDTAVRLGINCGDYLELRFPEQDTVIVRRVCCCIDLASMRRNYLYVDAKSLHYLNAYLNDTVTVSLSLLPLEVP